jgi:glycosyltransferase involved in cell wall biosynthesis
MSISIIIPVYNEEECIELCVEETQRGFRDVDYEIIVVNDGSIDRSHEIISNLAAGNGRIQYISYPENKGYSHAIRQGIRLASKEYTSYLDADLQYLPMELRKMYEFAVKNQYAFVLGKPTQKYYKFPRHLMSLVYNFLVAQLFNVRVGDANSLKLIATQTLKGLELKREFGGIELEILLGMMDHSIPITLFPIQVQERFAGKSKAGLKIILSTLRHIIDLRRLRRRNQHKQKQL